MNFEQINQKYNTEFTNRLFENKHIFYEIYEACGCEFQKGCGSYLFDGQTYKYCDEMYPKQELLYNCVKDTNKILEIGTYVGHSLFIMLLSNPKLRIICIDIDDRFTQPAVNVLNKHFNNAITFIHSDSLLALSSLDEKFDFFHIDGHHDNDYITKEFYNIIPLNNNSENKLRLIFDDQECLEKLQNQIVSNHTVTNMIIPKCNWNNIYLEIQL